MKACSLAFPLSVTLSVSPPGKPVFEEGTFAQELAGGRVASLILVSWEEDESLTLTSKSIEHAQQRSASPTRVNQGHFPQSSPESSISQAKLFEDGMESWQAQRPSCSQAVSVRLRIEPPF